MNHHLMRIHPEDHLIVALSDLPRDTSVEVDGESVALPQTVRAKHKFVLRNAPAGSELKMYGVPVAEAIVDLPAGTLITTSNVRHRAAAIASREAAAPWRAPDVSRWAERTFDGFHRADGRVGTRNHWLIIPLVFCENQNLLKLRNALLEPLGYGTHSGLRRQVEAWVGQARDGTRADALPAPDAARPATRLFPNVDGIKFLAHDLGCGGMRQDADTLCGLLAGYINHPNVAGATVLSLGCQNATIDDLQAKLAARNPTFDKPLTILNQQTAGSEQAFLERAVLETLNGLELANACERAPAPLSAIVLGNECGASDGFSGISGNPAVGAASDLLVALGASVILSEFPELCGAEQDLINRCANDELAEYFAELMRTYNERAHLLGSGFEFNPTAGNIADGLITDAIKSVGAARKGGTSPVIDVQDYPGQIDKPGLTLLCTPGNDVESTTAMAGAGATILSFTTGLGTPTGSAVAPTVKISTNTELAKRMSDIIDYDAGPVIRGEKSLEECGAELLDLFIEVANGKLVAAERKGQDDFLPWKRGVSL